jgi:CRP-like cAMP-binding protein
MLALLPDPELARLMPDLALVDLRHHDVIYGAGAEVDYVYFPLSAVMSVIATDSEGRGVEAASVGREGMVGLAGALGARGTIGEVINQVNGSALRIPIDPLRREIEGARPCHSCSSITRSRCLPRSARASFAIGTTPSRLGRRAGCSPRMIASARTRSC